MNGKMLTLILVSVFVTVIQLSTTSSNLGWNMPCFRGGKKTDMGPKAVTIPNEPLANLEKALNEFLEYTANISNQAHSIKKRWLDNRFQDNVDFYNWVLKSVKSPTSLPNRIYYENGRPMVNESGICNGSCITFLRNVSESLRKEAMHLEIIREHENAEYLTGKTADITDTHLLQKLESLMYDLVCEINQFANETEDGLVKFYQTEIPSGWKNHYPNKSERYARDLVLIHHVHRLVDSVKDSFSHVMAERF